MTHGLAPDPDDSWPGPPGPGDSCRGAGGSRDLHLENFNLSNGGKDLISEATLTLTYGRRYGLVGRNGTGVCVWGGERWASGAQRNRCVCGGGDGLVGRNGTGLCGVCVWGGVYGLMGHNMTGRVEG